MGRPYSGPPVLPRAMIELSPPVSASAKPALNGTLGYHRSGPDWLRIWPLYSTRPGKMRHRFAHSPDGDSRSGIQYGRGRRGPTP